MEVTWNLKAQRPDIQGPGVEKAWGWWRKGTKWGKETHSCGTQRGSPWRSSRPERKEVEKGQPQSPISREGSSQRCHNLSLEPQEERREVMRRKRAEQTMMKKHNHSNTVSGNGKPPNVWKLNSTIVFVFYCFVKNYPKV